MAFLPKHRIALNPTTMPLGMAVDAGACMYLAEEPSSG